MTTKKLHYNAIRRMYVEKFTTICNYPPNIMKILDSISHIYNIELLASLLPMSGKQCYIHCFIMIKIIVQKDVEWSGIWENRESENVINLFCTLYEYYFYLVFFVKWNW